LENEKEMKAVALAAEREARAAEISSLRAETADMQGHGIVIFNNKLLTSRREIQEGVRNKETKNYRTGN